MRKCSRILTALLAVCLMAMLGLPTALAAPTPVSSIKLNASKKTLTVGAVFQLKATVKPAGATDKRLTWSSSDKRVATVSAMGRVKARRAGTVAITCAARDGSGQKAVCKITVKPIRVTSVKLNKQRLTLKAGSGYALKATVKPSNASDKSILWSSSDETVATVSEKGYVTAVQSGTATVTAKAKDGSGKKATCKITVSPASIPVAEIALNTESATLKPGEGLALIATVKPDNASDKSLNWSSSDEAVATVAADGRVTAIKAGTATVTAKAKDGSGVKATCKIIVEATTIPVAEIALNTESATLKPGEGLTLIATVKPDNASDKSLSWSSSDEAVATVAADGRVTAIKAGTATVTAKAKDGSGVKAACKIAVASSESVQDAVFRITNEERVQNGLAPLSRRLDVEARALIRAKEIVSVFSHTRPDGTSCFTVLDGISYRTVGENIAMGYPTPEAVMNGWMNSSGHRANILNGNFTGLGVGAYRDNGTWHWVQLFIG